jgi:uncharacterized RDD family membrane protein YckC
MTDSAALAETRYAGFWLRLVALLIDAVITGVLSFVAGVVTGILGAGNPDAASSVAAGVGTLLGLAYYVVLEGGPRQATFGKSLLGLKVTDSDGNPIGYGKALLRTIAKIVSGLIIGIGYLMAAFTARKQALHDMIAGTLVVRR